VLPLQQNLEAGLMCKMTLFVQYHVLSLEYRCFLTANKLSFRIDGSARCIIMLLLDSIFALCMCNSCRIGEVYSVGNELY